ncbi:hypothetical protein PCK1_002878 [Pneumocystis canis]|nr:hypothetical protein PCK1_002878 [Pneumocystis canis]
MGNYNSLYQKNHKKHTNISLNIEFDTKDKENNILSPEKCTFTTNDSLLNYLNSSYKSPEKNIPWLCSSCCETFSSDKLMYNTIDKHETYYCKNCHLQLSSKNNNISLTNMNNVTYQTYQNKNSQKYSEDTYKNTNFKNDLDISLNKESFFENKFAINIKNSDKILPKNDVSIISLEENTNETLKSSIKNDLLTINNLTSKVNISQASNPIHQNCMKNSEIWELLRKKKRNSLNVRKHIENFTEVKRLYNSSTTPDVINISSKFPNSPNKIKKTENIESKISSITHSKTQIGISQENILPTLTSTQNCKHKLFSTNSTRLKNNALSTIDCNSFVEKDIFSKHLKILSNNKQELFFCDSCKKDLMGNMIQISEAKRYHEDCFKCGFCDTPFKENEYISYKNNIYHEKCISELKSDLSSKSISPEKALMPETILNTESLKNNSPKISTKKKYPPKFGGFDKCAGCNQSITFLESYPGPNSTKWHKKCLKCSKGCGKNMDSGALNETDEDGKMKVYCRSCWDATKRGKKKITIPLVMSNILQDFSTLESHDA